jgi:hypothetical protein
MIRRDHHRRKYKKDKDGNIEQEGMTGEVYMYMCMYVYRIYGLFV